jgi:hypothetical protein
MRAVNGSGRGLFLRFYSERFEELGGKKNTDWIMEEVVVVYFKVIVTDLINALPATAL